ncbi:copper resistance D family protein [Salipaludibacillus sp. HK11]|uniref:copper resistance D family protein n=1 Tax=Salipaludibacillus sp. HK11 TaxID=3394320 RepID=UPI0039FC50E9
MIVSLSNGLLYICFAVVMGGCILSIVPENKKPAITLTNVMIGFAVILIPLLALVPVIDLAMVLNHYREESYLSSVGYIITNLSVGTSWLALTFLAIVFVILLSVFKKRTYNRFIYVIGIVLTFAMILTQAVVGHASNMGIVAGATSHVFHYAAISSWVGVLLLVSWLSTNQENWRGFLRWFTPLAIGCVATLAMSGFLMSYFITDNIIHSLALPYGQGLLWKYLLFLPVLIFALINGLLIKQKMKQDNLYSPRNWWRAESIILLVIFTVTAVLTEQETPQNVEHTLARGEASILFQTFASVPASAELTYQVTGISVLFLTLGVFFLGLIIYSFRQMRSPAISLLMAFIGVLSLYFGIMSGLG